MPCWSASTDARCRARFLSDASHELRTPIAVIQGYANMLNRWGKDDPAVRQEAISAIRAEADCMRRGVEQLLFLARGDNNTQTVHFKAFDLSAVVDEVYRETELLETGRQVGSAIQPGIRFYGDTGLLKQALRILVDNAVKYTPEGGALFVRLKGKEGIVQLSVSDTGQGIAPDDLPKVFQRFYRTDESRTRQTGGTGLGLSIAQWIATTTAAGLRCPANRGWAPDSPSSCPGWNSRRRRFRRLHNSLRSRKKRDFSLFPAFFCPARLVSVLPVQ
ncbi:MAG: ATP-binding protein [Oscillospiraceae bacterium]